MMLKKNHIPESLSQSEKEELRRNWNTYPEMENMKKHVPLLFDIRPDQSEVDRDDGDETDRDGASSNSSEF